MYKKKCSDITAGVLKYRKNQVFSRKSRVSVGDFRKKLRQNLVRSVVWRKKEHKNREKCKYLSTFYRLNDNPN